MIEAVIPYLQMPEKTLVTLPFIGQIKLQVFGPLVAIAVIVGFRRSIAFAKIKDMDDQFVRDFIVTTLIFAFVISHLVSVIFYFPHQIKEDPLVLIKVWKGLSSVGGFFGAWVGMIWFLRKHKQPFMPYGDMLMYGLPLGWVFGRLGCSLVHDHPGRIVDASHWLAVGPWPDGEFRYDLGLIECMFIAALTLVLYFVFDWRNKKPGWIIGFVAFLYAPFRFGLDFLRSTDPIHKVLSTPDERYAGLTTAQWFTVVFFLVGAYLLFLRKPKPFDSEYKKESDRVAREKEEQAKKAAEDEEPSGEEADAESPASDEP